MIKNVSLTMLRTKAARVSETCSATLEIEKSGSAYNVLDTLPGRVLIRGSRSELWFWLDAYEEGYNFCMKSVKIPPITTMRGFSVMNRVQK